jgi:hypothetical protein
VDKNLKRDYVTVEGFKLSSFKLALADLPIQNLGGTVPDGLKDFSLGVFWATKDASGKQAIAVAVGPDFAKTEQAFKSALEKTKTTAPVQSPEGIFSMQGLGKMLNQVVYPFAEKGGAEKRDLTEMKKVFDVLASAGNDATVTISAEVKPDRMDMSAKISGKAIQATISAVKLLVEYSEKGGLRRPSIQDF